MDEKPIGAIWRKTSKKNEEYLSIKIGEVQYVAFLNNKGGVDTRPDFQVYASKPREAQASTPDDRTIPF